MDPQPHAAPPPDRSHVDTEKRLPGSAALHTLSIGECVALITREDRAAQAAVEHAAGAVAAFITAAEPGFLAGGRLVYLGAGTSGRLGVLDASECPPTFNVPPQRVVGLIAGGDAALRRSSEGMEDDPEGAAAELAALALTPNDSVLGIAAGGTTPYVLGALDLVKRRGGAMPPVTGLLTCTSMPRPPAVDHLIVLSTGPEVITGSTRMKAGTATKMALNIISTTLMVRLGKVYENLMVDVRATNAKLRDRAARIISTLTGVERPAALALLDRCDGAVKTAVVVHRLGVEPAAADALLAAAHGRLDLVLSVQRPPAAATSA